MQIGGKNFFLLLFGEKMRIFGALKKGLEGILGDVWGY